MKTIAKHLFISVLFLGFTACDEVDEMTEFDVSDTFTTSAMVSVPEPVAEPENVSYTDVIDISENSDIQENYGTLQSVVIHEFYFEIKDFQGNEDAVLDNTTVTIGDIAIDMGTLNPYSADVADQLVDIGTPQQWNAIANMLMDSSTVEVSFSGTIDNTPAEFTIEATMSLTATFDAL